MLKKAIENYGVYSDIKLKNLIYDLEKKFNIKDETTLFNKLVNFTKNKNIPYHGWFKYREGFSHLLIRELISRCNLSDDEYILDPFCGSGTTIVESALNGISGIGIDINPMSAFITQVKCYSYTDSELNIIKTYIPKIIKHSQDIKLDVQYIKRYEHVEKFFNSYNFYKLLSIRQAIEFYRTHLEIKIYNFFMCAYISIIEDTSNRRRDGNGLKTVISKIEKVEDYYFNKLKKMVSDIEENRISDNLFSLSYCGNAIELAEIVSTYSNRTNKKLGAIIYSPPYANSFDYFESYKMEILLSDYALNTKDIGKYRKQAIESFIGHPNVANNVRDFVSLMSKEIENAIPEKESRTGKRDLRTRKVPKMLKGYFMDMEKVISESSAILTSGKKCYIVVDQSAYLGRVVPTDLFLASIAEDYGFNVNEIIVCRIAKTSAQQVKFYPYLSNTLRESIIVLEKA